MVTKKNKNPSSMGFFWEEEREIKNTVSQVQLIRFRAYRFMLSSLYNNDERNKRKSFGIEQDGTLTNWV
jgi:hypothetical protein